MSDYVPPEANRVMTYLVVEDALTMAEFYEKAFGFSEIERINDDEGNPVHIGMGYEGKTVVMFSPLSPIDEDVLSPKTSGAVVPFTIFVYCPDVDALYQEALAAGAKAISEPEDMFWGDRMCRVYDIENYRWAFSTYTGKKFSP